MYNRDYNIIIYDIEHTFITNAKNDIIMFSVLY